MLARIKYYTLLGIEILKSVAYRNIASMGVTVSVTAAECSRASRGPPKKPKGKLCKMAS